MDLWPICSYLRQKGMSAIDIHKDIETMLGQMQSASPRSQNIYERLRLVATANQRKSRSWKGIKGLVMKRFP
jgi:hypothetical protein